MCAIKPKIHRDWGQRGCTQLSRTKVTSPFQGQSVSTLQILLWLNKCLTLKRQGNAHCCEERKFEVTLNSMKIGKETYRWPSSWAMVKAVLNPLSSLIEQLLDGSQRVPSSARPIRRKEPGFTWMGSCGLEWKHAGKGGSHRESHSRLT